MRDGERIIGVGITITAIAGIVIGLHNIEQCAPLVLICTVAAAMGGKAALTSD